MIILVGGENESERGGSILVVALVRKGPREKFGLYLDLPPVRCVEMAGSHMVPRVMNVAARNRPHRTL